MTDLNIWGPVKKPYEPLNMRTADWKSITPKLIEVSLLTLTEKPAEINPAHKYALQCHTYLNPIHVVEFKTYNPKHRSPAQFYNKNWFVHEGNNRVALAEEAGNVYIAARILEIYNATF